MDKMKAWLVAGFAALSSWLGILAIPVYLLVLVNVIDYVTGIVAAVYRKEAVSSCRGIQGIVKKICMWLLVGVGSIIDILVAYGAEQAGLSLHFGYAVGSLVAVWLICNELISILENVADIGVQMPSFLMKLVDRLKGQVETQAEESVTEILK